MNTSDNRYEPGITPVKRVFLIAAAVFLLLATIVALQERKRLVLVKTIEELDRAKEFYKGQLLFTMEDTMSHMLWLGEKII